MASSALCTNKDHYQWVTPPLLSVPIPLPVVSASSPFPPLILRLHRPQCRRHSRGRPHRGRCRCHRSRRASRHLHIPQIVPGGHQGLQIPPGTPYRAWRPSGVGSCRSPDTSRHFSKGLQRRPFPLLAGPPLQDLQRRPCALILQRRPCAFRRSARKAYEMAAAGLLSASARREA